MTIGGGLRLRRARGAGSELLGEVGKERAALQSAGDRGREGSLDEALAVFGAGAVGELAMDDRPPQGALGGVIGGLDPSTVTKVHRAGQIFSRLLAKTR